MSIPKDEAKFKARLKVDVELELPRFVVFSHVDSTNGIPDWSLAGNGQGSWLEFKHATPWFSSRGIQVLTARRLAAAGECRYVVFWENIEGEKRTFIVHPRTISFGVNKTITPDLACEGHSNRFVIDYIKRVHRL